MSNAKAPLSPLLTDLTKDPSHTASYFSPASSTTATPSILRTGAFAETNLNKENRAVEIIHSNEPVIVKEIAVESIGVVNFGDKKGLATISTPAATVLSAEINRERQDDREASERDKRTKSRSPSPHCHFAPLPKLGAASVVSSRRNSVALGVVSRGRIIGIDSAEEPFAIELEEPQRPDFSSISALSNSLSTQIHSPRPTTPRSFSNPRSPSSSPSISRPTSAQGTPLMPPLSRKSSTDHISHHYIEATKSRSSSISRTSSQQGASRTLSKERTAEKEKEVFGFDVMRSREAASWREERNGPYPHLNHATVVVGNPSTLAPTPSAEARSLASLSSVLASTSILPSPISPVLPTRKTFFADPLPTEKEKESVAGRCRPVELIRRRSNEEVVEISPDQNEEVIDEEEEEEEQEEEEEEEETVERDGESDDSEIDEEPVEERNTARGAAVERVHWHRDDPITQE